MPDDKKDLAMGLNRCSISDFARFAGVSTRTLKRWDAAGTLPAGRLPSGRLFYTERHYAACGGDPEAFVRLVDGLKEGEPGG